LIKNFNRLGKMSENRRGGFFDSHCKGQRSRSRSPGSIYVKPRPKWSTAVTSCTYPKNGMYHSTLFE